MRIDGFAPFLAAALAATGACSTLFPPVPGPEPATRTCALDRLMPMPDRVHRGAELRVIGLNGQGHEVKILFEVKRPVSDTIVITAWGDCGGTAGHRMWIPGNLPLYLPGGMVLPPPKPDRSDREQRSTLRL